MLNVTVSGVRGILEQGRRAHLQGQMREAEVLYRRALQLHPDNPAGLTLLGTLAMEVGKGADAEALLRRAIAVEPRMAEAHNQLGALQAGRQQWAEAESAYRQALELRPTFPEAHLNLGLALVKSGRMEEGMASYRKAIEIAPKYAAAHYNLGMALVQAGKMDEAIESHRKAVELEPRFADSFAILGRMLLEKGRKEEARQVLEAGMRVHSASLELRFLLSAATGDQLVTNAPPGYVAGLFENYAQRFDGHLAFLKYQAPTLLAEAVHAAAPGETFDILDAGCGTGLCGEAFREMKRTLVGIDLSPRMVERARERGIYNEVLVGEMDAVLRNRAGAFDLVVAGDVLPYVGELEGLFVTMNASLRPGGLFAFTVEKAEGERVVLQENTRYAHPLNYLKGVARRHGMEIVSAEEKILRDEGGKGVAGWVMVMKKKKA